MWAGAAWIGGGSELRTDVDVPAGKIESARAYTAGVGVMELHLNGAKVADHYCDPGEAVYDQKILYLSFNVSSLLKAGSSNAIGARLGNSKWGYLDIYSNRTKHADQSGDSSRAFRMALVVTMADGTTHTFKTTPAGKVSPAARLSWNLGPSILLPILPQPFQTFPPEFPPPLLDLRSSVTPPFNSAFRLDVPPRPNRLRPPVARRD